MLKSLFWIGATGVALIAGIALHHGEEIAEAGHEIESVMAEIDSELSKAETDIEAGAPADARIEDAIATALVNSGAIDNASDLDDLEELDQLGERRMSVVVDGEENVTIGVENIVNRVRQKLDEAEGRLEEKREAGELSQQRYDEAMRDIAQVEEKLARVKDRIGS